MPCAYLVVSCAGESVLERVLLMSRINIMVCRVLVNISDIVDYVDVNHCCNANVFSAVYYFIIILYWLLCVCVIF